MPGAKRADCTTRPTPSIPGTYGSGGLPAGNRPDAIARSAGLSAAASSSTTAWPSAGCGSGRSPTSGGASYVETSAARNG